MIGFKSIVNHVGNMIEFVAKFSNLDLIDLFGALVTNKIKIIIVSIKNAIIRNKPIIQ